MEIFNKSRMYLSFGYLFSYPIKTTTVSLIEYPAIVKIAAIEAKFPICDNEKTNGCNYIME